MTATAFNALQKKDIELAAAYKIVDGVLQSPGIAEQRKSLRKFMNRLEKRLHHWAWTPSEVPGQARKKFAATTTTADDHAFTTSREYYHVKVFHCSKCSSETL